MKLPHVGCGALILRDGQVLLIKRLKAPEAEHWSLVGGRVEFGETSRAALVREVAEEVGIEVALEELVCLVETPNLDGQHWVSPVYRAKILQGEPKNREPGKIGAVQWFKLDSLPSPLSFAAQQVLALC